MWIWAKARRRQNIGYAVGVIIGLLSIITFFLPGQEKLMALGPMNVGHEEIGCSDCHQKARGTLVQQVQANVRFTLGLRKTAVDFGTLDVDNDTCLACHVRPNDRHPTHRFLEPRFAGAREAIAPQFCTSCHVEHTGKRVNIEPTYCMHCHQEMVMKNDPLTVSHEQLIAEKRWETCLGCHDFHGNHVMETEVDVDKALTVAKVLAYFEGGPSPFSTEKYHQALTEEESSNE